MTNSKPLKNTYVPSSTLGEFQLLDGWLEHVLVSDHPDAALASVLAEIDRYHPHLKSQFLDLIEADEASQWSWEQGQFQLMPSLVAPLALNAGDQLGEWVIIDELGRGGMGVVYEVHREHHTPNGSFTQRGALKLITTPQINMRLASGSLPQERFLREMATLSSLAEHPNIAQFLDAGMIPEPQSTPYFVMEYIEGSRLDEHCDQHKMTIRQRVVLFLEVARAVHFMHLRGVIHRDLKPQNILVTTQGHCKILDLGIAQSTSSQDVKAYTPTWASPEQIAGESITTASDVYNMGLLLLLLIWGDHEPHDLTQTIRTRWSCIDESRRAELAQSRGYASNKALRQVLSMELDAIVARALAPEPDARYASADSLAQDLENWLEGRPIQTLMSTPGYTLWFSLRRHRLVLIGVLCLIVVLVGWSISLVHQNRTITLEKSRVELAKDKASHEALISNDLAVFLEKMLAQSNPVKSGKRTETVEDVLNRSAASLRSKNALRNPRIKATLFRVMGEAYLGLGLDKKAEPLLKQALALTPMSTQIHCHGSGSALEPARLAIALGRLEHLKGSSPKANAIWLDMLSRCLDTPVLQDDQDLRIRAHLEIANVNVWAMANNVVARHHYDQALALTKGRTNRDSIEGRISALAGRTVTIGERVDTIEMANHRIKEALTLADRVWHNNHPKRAQLYSALAYADPSNGAGVRWQEKSVKIFEHVYGPNHLYVAQVLNDLALNLETTQPARAMKMMSRVYEIYKQEVPVDHEERLTVSTNWAAMLREARRFDEASQILEQNHKISNSPSVISNLALLRRDQGRYLEAIDLNLSVLNIMGQSRGNKDYRTAMLHIRLAHLYFLTDQPQQVDHYLNGRFHILKPITLHNEGALPTFAQIYLHRALKRTRAKTLKRR